MSACACMDPACVTAGRCLASTQGADLATLAAVFAGISGKQEARCPHCGKSDPTWRPHDLSQGRRPSATGGIEYHCYAGYVLD